MDAIGIVNPANLVAHLPYAGLVVLFVLGTLGLPFPEDGILILAGVLYATNAVSLVPVAIVVYVSLLATDSVLYTVGRKLGPKVVAHPRFRRYISASTWSRLERSFAKWRFWVILAARNLIGVRAQVFLAAGALGVAPSKFVAADGVAALVSMGTWMTIGYLGTQGFTALAGSARTAQWIATIAAAVIVAAGVGVLLWVRRTRPRGSPGTR